MKTNWLLTQRILTVTGGFAAIIGLYLNAYELRNISLVNSADFVLKLDGYISDSTASQIANAIEQERPVLKEHGGSFQSWELDRYLSGYETVSNFYSNRLLNRGMIESAFSYDVVRAYKNTEIMDYVHEAQKEDPLVFQGFVDLAQEFIN